MGIVCNECKACIEQTSRKKNKSQNPAISSNKTQNRGGNRANNDGISHVSDGDFGVGSGSSCYTCSAKINQRPETGRDDFRIQINAQHHGNHSCDEQLLTVIFNHPVTFISCSNGSLNSPNNKASIQVKLRYHNNQNDNIGMGDFTVKSTFNDLSIVNCYINDGH